MHMLHSVPHNNMAKKKKKGTALPSDVTCEAVQIQVDFRMSYEF